MKHNTIIIALLMLSTIIIAGCSSSNQNSNLDSLAQCMSEKGTVMYGTEWCSHCQNQKKMFGSSFKHINFVDCDKNKNECIKNNVEGYPTWKINESLYPGQQEIYRLAELSGCNQ